MVLISYPCLYCGSPDTAEVTRQSDIRYHPQDEFRIVRCGSCGVLFTAPPVTEESIGRYYPPEYGAYVSSDAVRRAFANACPEISRRDIDYCLRLREELVGHGAGKFRARAANDVRRLRSDIHGIYATQWYLYALPLKHDKTRVLYLGSGSPERFRDYQIMPGVQLSTVDINVELCEAYCEAGVAAHAGTVTSVDLDGCEFDVIFSSHVVEHLLQPQKELQRLARLLASDGIMVCGLPDYGAIEWRIKPVYYDVPRHQIHLTHTTAMRMFSDAGLRVLRRIHTPYGYGFFQNRFLKRFLNDPAFNPATFADPLDRRMRIASTLLSFVGQSGNVVYYLGRLP